MPIYEFRLEAQDGSGHFRSGATEARSEDAARAFLELKELERALYQLPDAEVDQLLEAHGAETLDDLPCVPKRGSGEAAKAEFRALPVRDRARLNIHRQEKPYKLVHLAEREG